jgi:glycosyltransferase involved in cell wall biosynthesis
MPATASGVAVVIPTFNEVESIGGVVAGLPRDIVERVIVVDGGSSDGTADAARRAGAEVIAVGRGYGRACLAGALSADSAAIIVFMDGDGADDPAAVADMVGAIASGRYDFVIGSRTRGEREPGSMSGHQIFAGHLAGALTALLYGVRYTDMCAYRAIRRDALLGLGMRELTYGWNLEMQMRAARAGLRILELPVAYRRRSGGQSKVAGNWRGSIKASLHIIATFTRVAIEPAPRRTASAQSAR